MANLIITVIAIALVAVASLMGAYYGGSAFLNNQSAAGASTVINAGQQLAGAWQAYMSDNYNAVPTDLNLLTGGPAGTGTQYLASIPQWPAAAGPVTAATMGVTGSKDANGNAHYYAIADVGAAGSNGPGTTTDTNSAACQKIVKTATGTAGITSIAPTANTATTINDTTIAAMVTAAASGNGKFGCAYMTAVPTLYGTTGTMPTAVKHYVMAYKLS
jgi:hypothetical protein